MRLKGLVALLMATAVCTHAQNGLDAPDFAFPKTVIKNAEEALKTSTARGDAIGELQALMQITVAQKNIDSDSQQASLNRILEYGHRQRGERGERGEEMAGLFDLCAASVARNIYQSQQWKYNRRDDMPLSPRPADMTEWSGAMMRNYIDSLCREAWKHAGDMSVNDLTRVIDINDLSTKFYPTLADVEAAIIANTAYDAKLKSEVDSAVLARQRAGSPTWYMLTGRKILNGNATNTEKLNELLSLYNAASEPNDALILWQYICDSNLYGNIMSKPRFADFAAQLQGVADRTDGLWIHNALVNECRLVNQPQANIAGTDTICAGTPVRLTISEFRNIGSLKLSFKRFNSQKLRDNYMYKNSGRPLSTTTFAFDMGPKTVVARDTTVTVVLPAGYYTVRAYANGDEKPLTGAMQFESLKYTAAGFQTPKNKMVVVMDAATGQPVQGVKVNLYTYRSTAATASAVTDRNGIAGFDKQAEGYVEFTRDGVVYRFNDIFFNKDRRSYRGNNTSATMTTDLGLYHPGDTVRWMGVCMNDSTVAENLKVRALLQDTDWRKVAEANLVTDEYGRVSGQFDIPDTVSRMGMFSISLSEDGGNNLGTCRFNVTDYKMESMKIKNLRAITLMPADSAISVTGQLVTYADAAISGATIKLSMVNFNGSNTDSLTEVTTGADGKFAAKLKFRPGKLSFGNMLTLKVEAIGTDGSTTVCTEGVNTLYNYTLNVGKFNHIIDVRKPMALNTTLQNAYGETITSPIKWTLADTLATGTFQTGETEISLARTPAGRYALRFCPADTTLAAPVSYSVTVYNPEVAVLPVKTDIVWLPERTVTANDGKATFTLGVSEPGALVNMFYQTNKGVAVHRALNYKAGYQTVSVNISDIDIKDAKLYLVAVRGGKVQSETLAIDKPRVSSAPKLVINSFRDRVTAGATEVWKVRFTDGNGRPLQGAMIAKAVDQRVNDIAKAQTLSISPRNYFYSSFPSLYIPYAGNFYTSFERKYDTLVTTQLIAPSWKYNLGGAYVVLDGTRIRGVGRVMTKASANNYLSVKEEAVDEAAPLSASLSMSDAESADGDAGSAETGAADLSSVELRIDTPVSALWLPNLVTDADGQAQIPFTAPNANTTWQVNLTAWSKDLRSAAADTTVVASKPVMVSMNTPRFVRTGDRVVVIANIFNNTDSTLTVTADLEATADSTAVLKTASLHLPVEAHSFTPLQIEIPVPASASKIFVTARAATSGFSDGERQALPVLPSQSQVREAINFYLNPGDSIFSLELPKPKGKDFSMELTYTENPMWTVVEALPGLYGDDVYPTANSQACALFAASTALGLMNAHPELGYTFNRKGLERAIDKYVKTLVDLQNADGGWQWGTWSRQSSLWATSAVLDIMATLKNSGYMPDNSKLAAALARAVHYYDANVRDTDLLYTLTRPAFANVQQSLNGKHVADRTIQWILRDWKKFSISTKAEAATALKLNGNANTARLLLSSISQFGIQTPNKGLEFRNVHSLQAYALLLEAYATAEPGAPEIDGIRQYLIVRKQATDWGNSLITSWIVQAMVNSGTPWAQAAKGAVVRLDSGVLSFTPTDRMGTLKSPVTGTRMVIETSAKAPSYGAVVATYTAPTDSIAAYSDGEISVAKSFNVERNGKWMPVTDGTVNLGDKVRIVLTVKADRPMSNVIISDDRAATFEPVDQLPGWVYADALSAYRQNADATTDFFIDYLPRGTFILTYDVHANNPGTFAGGVAKAVCAQAPSLTAHSSGTAISVTDKKH